MTAVTTCSDFGVQKNKVCHCFHCFLIYLPWSNGTECHDLSFLNVEFKPTFSLSSFTFIKRLFSSSSLLSIRVVPSAYLRLLIFLLANLIPAYTSSSLAFRMMYSAYMLNKQGENIQPWHTLPVLEPACFSMSNSNCGFLTCIQISQEAGKVVRYSDLFKNFPQFIVIHTIKGFGVVIKAEVDVFWNSLSLLMIQRMLVIWSLVSLPFLNWAWTLKFTVHVLLKPDLENFEYFKIQTKLKKVGETTRPFRYDLNLIP